MRGRAAEDQTEPRRRDELSIASWWPKVIACKAVNLKRVRSTVMIT